MYQITILGWSHSNWCWLHAFGLECGYSFLLSILSFTCGITDVSLCWFYHHSIGINVNWPKRNRDHHSELDLLPFSWRAVSWVPAHTSPMSYKQPLNRSWEILGAKGKVEPWWVCQSATCVSVDVTAVPHSTGRIGFGLRLGLTLAGSSWLQPGRLRIRQELIPECQWSVRHGGSREWWCWSQFGAALGCRVE